MFLVPIDAFSFDWTGVPVDSVIIMYTYSNRAIATSCEVVYHLVDWQCVFVQLRDTTYAVMYNIHYLTDQVQEEQITDTTQVTNDEKIHSRPT